MEINPEMIRLARVSRGKQQVEVAEALGIRQPTYSKIESGAVGLGADHLRQLSHFLGFPEAFFAQTDRVWGSASPHHRKRKTLTQTQLGQIEAQLNVLRLQLKRLATNVQVDAPFPLPQIDLDEVGTPAEAAQELRRLWRVPIGPVTNMTTLLEDAGVVIIRWEMPSKFDAMSVQGLGEPAVVLANSIFPTDRQRFTLAHELGHLCLHTSEVTPDPEAEADEFARELLMPSREIRPELRHLRFDQLPDLKRRWKCSMRAIVVHAQRLGELSKAQARYLFIRLNDEFGANREPIPLPDEPPMLMRELIDSHLDQLAYTIEELAAIVRTQPADFMVQHDLNARLRAL